MAKKVVRYYFGFASPFGALADARIDELVGDAGAELDPVPVLAPPGEPLEGFAATLHEFKNSYQYEDAARWARKLGLSWNPPDDRPVTLDASVGYYVARESGVERAYRNRVFKARWSEGRDIDDRGVLAECAADVGLLTETFKRALDDRKYHDELSARGLAGMEDRVFGVPLFVVDGERFWGNDRLEFLSDFLAA